MCAWPERILSPCLPVPLLCPAKGIIRYVALTYCAHARRGFSCCARQLPVFSNDACTGHDKICCPGIIKPRQEEDSLAARCACQIAANALLTVHSAWEDMLPSHHVRLQEVFFLAVHWAWLFPDNTRYMQPMRIFVGSDFLVMYNSWAGIFLLWKYASRIVW